MSKEELLIQLLEESKEQFYRLAFSYVKNEQDALEIIQESAYKAYCALDHLKSAQFFKTWFTRILINCSIDFIQKGKRIVPVAFEEERQIGSDEMVQVVLKLDVEKALQKLEPHEKTVVVLRYFEELKFEEISVVLEKPVSTIKSTLYRTLKKLKSNFEEADL